MARPLKKGIPYFSLDVDFLSDIKVRRILRGCGTKSIAILISLLGNIYRDEGYYLRWDDDVAFLVADEVGTNEGSVEEVVNKAVQVDFFNAQLFEEQNILTSKGIQDRYKIATERRKDSSIQKEYDVLLIGKQKHTSNVVNVDNNSINDNRSTQSKVKQSKVKQSKLSADTPPQSFDEFNIYSFVQENFGRVLKPLEMETLSYWVKDYDTELIKEAIKRTVLKNIYNLGYPEGILKNWEKNNITNMGMVQEQDAKHSKKQTNYSNASTRKETLPDWASSENQIYEETPLSPEEEAEIKAKIERLSQPKQQAGG